MGQDFSPEQKRYLEGFASGVSAGRLGRPQSTPAAEPTGPDAIHLTAMKRTETSGKKLADQEKWKRDEHPFDAYPRLNEQAARDEFPKPPDNFRWRYYGLFYVAPNQNSYMARLRIANGVLTHWQFAGLADVAEKFGGGYSHVTTRANLQIREIAAHNAVNVIEAVSDVGLTARGSGADNIRNVTGDATAGIAPCELIDTRPYARAWHFHILNDRSLYGLPRKFNVAFDGGGPIPTLEETNDIGFQAIEVREGAGIRAGLWFRLVLGGISGHKDLARDTGVVVELNDATKVADAIVRVFIENGDRSNRAKARLKYVLDAWGFDTFLAAVEKKLGRPFDRVGAAHVAARPVQDRLAHIGVHPQKDAGLVYVGVALKLGRMSAAQMHCIADCARRFGDGDVRLTVWQNLLLSGVKATDVTSLAAALNEHDLLIAATPLRAGLIACTGKTGCKLANSQTKEIAQAIADWCEPRVALDTPINIHLTGCPNSCAQHYIGDIGLVGARVPDGDDGDTVDGFNIVIGGGYGESARIAREFAQNVRAAEAPAYVEHLLKTYLAHRAGPAETFSAFAARHETEALKILAAEVSP